LAFTVILIGKDGGEEAPKPEPVSRCGARKNYRRHAHAPRR